MTVIYPIIGKLNYPIIGKLKMNETSYEVKVQLTFHVKAPGTQSAEIRALNACGCTGIADEVVSLVSNKIISCEVLPDIS